MTMIPRLLILVKLLATLGVMFLSTTSLLKAAHAGCEHPQDPAAGLRIVTDDELQQKIEQWITQFSSGSFIERKVAMEKIFAHANQARPALKKALGSNHPEMARRAKYLLKLIDLGITLDTTPQRAAQLIRYHSAKPSERDLRDAAPKL